MKYISKTCEVEVMRLQQSSTTRPRRGNSCKQRAPTLLTNLANWLYRGDGGIYPMQSLMLPARVFSEQTERQRQLLEACQKSWRKPQRSLIARKFSGENQSRLRRGSCDRSVKNRVSLVP